MKKLVALITVVLILMFPLLIGFSDNKIELTEEQIRFINNHPVIRVGVDPKFVPFEFIDQQGEYTGIASEYLKIISEKTGLIFQIEKDLTWPQAYDKALTNDLDMLPAISKTEEREAHFIFSDPYFHFKRVIVIKVDEKEITDLEDLKGLTVAVQRNSSHHSYLSSYPNISLSLYDSVEAALAAVSDGTERVFVGNLATTNYLINNMGLSGLKYIIFEAEKEQAIHFAVRKDWPELTGIINKVLANVTDDEKNAISSRWIIFDTQIDYGPVIRITLLIVFILGIVIAVSFYWITKLKKEMKQRKLIQIDLEKAKKEADEANEYKSRFMARMSHEIRTPLNAITGMTYLLKKTELSMTQRMYSEKIAQASANMLSIINDILDFSKIEAGKIETENTSFSMDQVIQEVVNIVSYKIEEQKIGFRISKDPLIPNWFIGDPKRISQILLNILNNAAKFTEKGEVSLDLRLVAKENDKYHISFSIRDTGIGMTEEQVGKLFIPFTQGDSSINRRFGGSGLGLSIVKNLVDMMGGQIQVFSTVNEGSTFIITLKLNRDAEKEEEYRKDISANHFKNIRTLILEKTGSNMNLIDNYLSAFGMNCELTTSPISAVSMLEYSGSTFSKPFDLFIVDYETPEENAFKFVKRLRENTNITKFPKIIVLLPIMREDLLDSLAENGIDLGIGKPIIPSILFNGILEVFKIRALSASQPIPKSNKSRVVFDREHTVLIAEDNKTNQLIASSLLEHAGIKSIIASDGSEAVKLYKKHSSVIELILMDLHMPVMNGYDAAKSIKLISDKIPIIALTADVIDGVKEKCEQSGISDYISKPFDPDRFIDIISEILAKNEKDEQILIIESGLKNLGNDIAIYKEVLREYVKENHDIVVELENLVTGKKYDEAQRLIHKIKSSSGSIGARKLYEVSVKLHKALSVSSEVEINEYKEGFNLLLDRVFKEIEIYIGNDEVKQEEGI